MAEHQSQAPHTEQTESLAKRKRRIGEWTSLSPRIDSLIIDGSYVEFGDVMRSIGHTEPHPEAALGVSPAVDIPGANEGQDNGPIAKDFSPPEEVATTPRHTSERDALITGKLATASLVRTFSQLNDAGDYFTNEPEHFYPDGLARKAVVRLLARYLKVNPESLNERKSLGLNERKIPGKNLGMTPENLFEFKDGIESLGFRVKENGQATEVTVGDLLEIYSQLGEAVSEENAVGLGPVYTLPTSSEVAKKLLADFLSKELRSLHRGMKLESDLGMTGTSLSKFEDELENLGFERPNFDLSIESTVENLVETLTRQEDHLADLSATVIFPKTRTFYEGQREIRAARELSEVEILGDSPAVSWRQEFFKSLTRREPEGPLKFELQLGIPVITVQTREDFQALRPIAKRQMPEDISAYSFVVTRKNRLNPEGETQNFPMIVRTPEVTDEITLQHARAQLAYARLIDPESFTPVLISESPKTLKEDVSMKVKKYLLAILATHTEPVNWFQKDSVEREQIFPADQKDIFGRDRPLYLGGWLTKAEKALGRGVKQEIYEQVVAEMERDVAVICRLVKVRPTLEFQNFVGNYLSLFEDWEKAEGMFQNWEKRNVFRDLFRHASGHSREIFREKQPLGA